MTLWFLLAALLASPARTLGEKTKRGCTEKKGETGKRTSKLLFNIGMSTPRWVTCRVTTFGHLPAALGYM